MRHLATLVTLLIVLGITIFYDPATRTGGVFNNKMPDHCIVLIDREANEAYFFVGVDIGHLPANEIMEKLSKNNLKGLIIPVLPKNAPKIEY